MCFTAKPAVVCELSTRYEAAISISEASCMRCSSLYRWDAAAECRFVQQVQNTLPDQEQWISTCCPGDGVFGPASKSVLAAADGSCSPSSRAAPRGPWRTLSRADGSRVPSVRCAAVLASRSGPLATVLQPLLDGEHDL